LLGIKKPREGFQGIISLTTLLEDPKKDAKREIEDKLKKDITKKNVKKRIKDSLMKDTTNKNVNRESKDCLKKEHSEADAKEVVPNPKSPPAIGPYTNISTGGVGIQSESQYWQPLQPALQ